MLITAMFIIINIILHEKKIGFNVIVSSDLAPVDKGLIV